MTSSTTRAFMAKKQSTSFAQVANNLLTVLQGYSKTIRLLLVMFVALTVSANVWGADLAFNFTTPVTNWPTSSQAGNYIYELNSTSYTFILGNNVYCNSGYLMLKSTTTLGLPAIEGMKLTKIVVHNSSGCSTSTNVSVCSNITGTTVSGGNGQVFSKTDKDYTYNLSNTLDNTVYYLRITTKNCQITKLTLTYETAAASCDKKVSLTKGDETNGTFTLDKANDSYDNCDENFVVKVSNIVPISSSQYCNGINVTGGNSSVTGPVDGIWTVTYAKGNNITSTITPTYAAKTSANISFENMGNPTPTTTGYYVGDTYTLPATNDYTCGDKTFVGWSTVEINNSASKPASNYYAKGASVTLAANQTFYAVFATAEGSQNVFKRMQTLDDLNNASKIAIINAYSSSAYILNTSLTAAAEAPGESSSKITVTEGQYWTLEKSNSYWKFKNADNKYLTTNTIPTSSSKSGSVQLATSGNNEWVIAENTYTNNGTPVFTIYNATSTTAGLEYNNGWILYYSTNFNTSWFTLKLYIPDVSYSDYTTQCSKEPSRYLTPKYRGGSGGT